MDEYQFEKAMSSYWQELSQKKEEKWYAHHMTSEECRFVLDAMKLLPPARILDLFCGWGRHIQWLRKKGYQAFGIDALYEGLFIYSIDIRDYRTDITYDAVICFNTSPFEVWRSEETIEHMLNRIYKMLKRRGHFWFGWRTNRFRYPEVIRELAALNLRELEPNGFHNYNNTKITSILKRCGFTVMKTFFDFNNRSGTRPNREPGLFHCMKIDNPLWQF